MKMNFNSRMISSSPLKRLFWEVTTDVNKHPGFTFTNCRLVCPDEYPNAMCLDKINDTMLADECSVVDAISKLMKIYGLLAVKGLELKLTKNVPGFYLPISVTVEVSIKKLHVDSDTFTLDVKFRGIKTVQGGLGTTACGTPNPCAQEDIKSECLTGTNWKVQLASMKKGHYVVHVDTDTLLWSKRCNMLKDYLAYKKAKNENAEVLPEPNNIVLVLIEPEADEFIASWRVEGVSKIKLGGYGYDYESAKDIYEGLLKNQIALIREDFIEGSDGTQYAVYTCTHVGVHLLSPVCSVPLNEGETPHDYDLPLEDCVISHMREFELLKDVKLSFSPTHHIDNVESDPYAINPQEQSVIRFKIGTNPDGMLNYTATFIDKNIDKTNVEIGEDIDTSIPNSGCPCKTY